MPDPEDNQPSGSPIQDRRPSNAESSDHSNTSDTFEDAPNVASPPRSLTSRSVSTSRPSAAERGATPDDHKMEDQGKGTVEETALNTTDGQDKGSEQVSLDRGSSSKSRRLSDTSELDNVNLEDDTSAKARAQESFSVPPEDITKEATERILSLSSITSALPAMPWSPPTESPTKTPFPPAPTNLPPPNAAPARKLTSPFSWLSRSSTGKDRTGHTSPPPATGRRNTASSVTTLTSNPEMMLSKLDEEQGHAFSNGTSRNSLKDRFKLLRMREEAGIPTHALDDNSDGAIATLARSNTASLGLATVGEAATGDGQSLPSPVPAPDESMVPGTVSGVNAGPSAMFESQVDWDLWQSVVYEGPAAVARTSPEELNRAIATGIPSAIRGVIWQVLAQSKSDDLEEVYHDLVARGRERDKDRRSNSTTASQVSLGKVSTTSGELVSTSSGSSVHSERSGHTNGTSSPKREGNSETDGKSQVADAAERARKMKDDSAKLQKLEKIIRRDLGARTSFSKYAAAAGLQDGLFGVCKAYALFDEGVGYAQGMNFLIMPLLFNMPEQEAFCLLVRLMNQYHLRDLFIQDMPGLHMHLYQFERLLEDFEPALYCHLSRRNISPHLYATQWFLTLFAYRFPLQLVLRIYDLILSEGLSAILRFGIVLMQKNASALLAMSDMQQLTVHLKDKLFDIYIDKDPSQGSLLESGFFGSSSASMDKEVYRADQLVRDACEVKITPEMLRGYTQEWEEKTKFEKGRETELLELRAANQGYAVQVRKLEERVEAADREQAALATELVHTKVENEELKDENEGLKGQVIELRNVIEKQPLEIEEAWKLERDSLMKRNENVHEENQKLEKELADLEEQLVQTKMQYAEINSQHETLNRKWSDLKRQFS